MCKHFIGSLMLIALMGAAPKDGEDRAKRLFDNMEQKVVAAKTLECTFELKAEFREANGGPATLLSLDGSIVIADGNRTVVDIRESAAGRPPFHQVVSDGNRWWWHDKGSPPHLVNNRPMRTLTADSLATLVRAGVFLPTLPLPPVHAADAKDRFAVSNFRLGPQEKIGQRAAQRIDYDLIIKGQTQPDGGPMPFPVAIWVDPATFLPIKRVVTQKLMAGSGLTLEENYRKFVPGVSLDSKTFDLPVSTKDTMIDP